MTLTQLLILHASPTLANLKPASLVCLKGLDEQGEDLQRLEERGLSFLHIVSRTGCRLLLVYRRKKLEQTISTQRAQEILRSGGFSGDLDCVLDQLRQRFLTQDCPHEVGLFLGYPEEDVAGFIENCGKNALRSLFWKVYSDVQRAERIAACWTECRAKYLESYANGTDIARLCVAV